MIECVVKVEVIKDYFDYINTAFSLLTGIISIIAIYISIKSLRSTNSRNLKEMFEKEISNYPSFLNSDIPVFKIINNSIVEKTRKSFKEIIEFQMNSEINKIYYGTSWDMIANSIDLIFFERVDKSKMTNSDKYDIFKILTQHYGVYLTQVGSYKNDYFMYYTKWGAKTLDNSIIECGYEIESKIEYKNSEFFRRITLLENKVAFYKEKLFKTKSTLNR